MNDTQQMRSELATSIGIATLALDIRRTYSGTKMTVDPRNADDVEAMTKDLELWESVAGPYAAQRAAARIKAVG